jgi:hypothetical protein
MTGNSDEGPQAPVTPHSKGERFAIQRRRLPALRGELQANREYPGACVWLAVFD